MASGYQSGSIEAKKGTQLHDHGGHQVHLARRNSRVFDQIAPTAAEVVSRASVLETCTFEGRHRRVIVLGVSGGGTLLGRGIVVLLTTSVTSNSLLS